MRRSLAFPTKSLVYPWQVKYHRIRLRGWATRELSGLLMRDADRAVAKLHDTRRLAMRTLTRCSA